MVATFVKAIGASLTYSWMGGGKVCCNAWWAETYFLQKSARRSEETIQAPMLRWSLRISLDKMNFWRHGGLIIQCRHWVFGVKSQLYNFFFARNAISYCAQMFHWGKWKKRMGASGPSKRPVFDDKEDGECKLFLSFAVVGLLDHVLVSVVDLRFKA